MGIDIAIDLGTSRTRIFLPDKGVVVDEPSVITVDLMTDAIIAVGQKAYEMLGRTSERMSAMYPLSGGVITDFSLVENMIKIMLSDISIGKVGMPKVVACIPSEITEVEKRAVVNAISSAGIRRVCLVEEPVAAAMGAGIDITSPHGSMVVDIGGGTTDIAVISLGGISVSRSIKKAGNVIDDEIIKYVKKKYNLLIGKRTAENAKIAIGCVGNIGENKTFRLKGRNCVTGMPMQADISSYEISDILVDIITEIVYQVQDVLEETPPELMGDIYSDGIILTGGTAQLKGMAEIINAVTKIKVKVADNPSLCVVKGCGEALKYIKAFEKGELSPISEQY